MTRSRQRDQNSREHHRFPLPPLHMGSLAIRQFAQPHETHYLYISVDSLHLDETTDSTRSPRSIVKNRSPLYLTFPNLRGLLRNDQIRRATPENTVGLTSQPRMHIDTILSRSSSLRPHRPYLPWFREVY